ncbi:glycosyltransferase [Microbacterium sp.]|uniref:glycosyltransferase n=1 Tax=Microbacterium sp. TaxID=51671 RepID=UPI003F704DE1
MPASVHALVVVRPDGRTPAAHHLRRTIAALSIQTRAVDRITIVLCGDEPGAMTAAEESTAAAVVRLPASTTFADAVAEVAPDEDADAVWLLAQDTSPLPDALARLVDALELSPSVALVGPKLVRADDHGEIVSLGVSMTRFGRAVGLADGELDQGQHDGASDVLGADVRSLLVRADAWSALGGLDRALSGADEGLDLGVRARLSGARVALAPTALVAVSGDGVAGLPLPMTAAHRRRIAFARRTAALHRRLVYARAWAVPLLWLAVLPLAVWRTALQLVRKQPGLIGPEWAAGVVSMVRVPSVARARRGIARTRRASWAQLAPLRVTRGQLRSRLEDDPVSPDGRLRSDLRFFSGGGAWLVLGALVVSIAAFPALLAWPVLGGGGLEPLRSTVAQLWADAAFGLRASGLETIGPADPFAVVIAIVGSLSPFEPSRALVVLWLLALPLAALGGWFAATRVTERSGLRLLAGVVWALSPTFLAALTQGRPSALIAHLLLPWLFYAGSVAHRSWAAAGAASLVFAGVVACAPSLAPALVIVWIGAIVLAIVLRTGRGVARLVWLVVPALALALPFAWRAATIGDAWWMAADPGATWLGPQVAADAAGRALLAMGFPSPDVAGWTTLVGENVWWVPLLSAPLALLALLAPLTPRWSTGLVLLLVTALGVGTAFAAVGVSVAFTPSIAAPLWPGTGLSLAWLGVLGGAIVALDAGLDDRVALLRGAIAGVVVAGALVLAVPSLTAVARDTALLTNGPRSTLPAYVAARGADDPNVGTLVLTPLREGGASAVIVWGGGETLGSQSTIVSTATVATAQDDEVAQLAAGLMTGSAEDLTAELVDDAVSFVLLANASDAESDDGRALSLAAESAIDQRAGLEAVGTTTRGILWRVVESVPDRAEAPASVHRIAGWIAALQIAIAGIAVLLAVPTAATRRDARRTPRVVGLGRDRRGAS